MSSKANEFDAIVVGSGLSGLVVACGLSRNQKVALVDKSETPGGVCQTNSGYKDLTGHFHTLPVNEDTQKALDFLAQLLGHPLKLETIKQPPLIFEFGFQPFVGFGDKAPLCLDELNYYLSPDRIYLHEGPECWIDELIQKFRGEFFNLSHVTRLLIENHQCMGVMINGQKPLYARKIIFCSNPKNLLELTDQENLPIRWRQKISKSTLWTSILLQLVHSHLVCENRAMHVLGLKTETEGFGIGQFSPPLRLDDGTVIQSSQWLTFVSEAEGEDEEILGLAVRRLKKLIQKAFPQSFSDLKYEKIRVNPHSHGKIPIPLGPAAALEGIKGLYLVSPLASGLKNIAGSLQQAEICLSGLGYCPAP